MTDMSLYRHVGNHSPDDWVAHEGGSGGIGDCWLPVTEALLTREEAANDPEVQEMVYRQWQRQNEAPTVYSVHRNDSYTKERRT